MNRDPRHRALPCIHPGVPLALALTVAAAAGCSSPSNEESPGGTGNPARDENLASEAGDYALAFLRAAPLDRLVVEVDWVAGHAPSGSALDALATTLARFCNKAAGIQVILDDEIPSTGSPEWTYEAAEDLEIEWRDRYRDPATGLAVMYFLYLDGNSEFDTDSGRILGYAYHGSSVILFQETIEATGSGLALFADVEDTVIRHEAGHLLGLVNNGVAMVENHQDPAHGAHDTNSECIMYWAIETDGIVDILLDRAPDFDARCQEDILAAGGKS